MADLSKTIAIIFSGVDELSGPMASMSKKLSTFGGDLQSMGAPLDAAAMNILKLDAALAAMAAGGLTYAFIKSMEFENAVIELKKVLGDGAGTEQAIEEATRLSEIYGESASSVLLSAADFKQAGYDIDDALTLTKDSMDLVIAGNIEAAEASNLIIAALKGFGEEADSARKFIDILNEVSNNYATDVQQLATGMAALSPIAKQMGFSMEETAGILTPVIEIFRSGDEAANALKTGLLKLIDDSKPVQDALAALGISQLNVNGTMKSGKEIYLEVATAFQGLTKEEKIYYTQQLTGIHQSAKMVTVFDNLALATKITETAMNAAGSAAKEVAARLESAEISVKRFKVSFENLATTIGDQFKVATKEAIDGGTEIEQVLRKMVDDGTFAPVFDAINKFAINLGDFLTTVAGNLPEAFKDVKFDDLLTALGDVGEALKGMFGNFDLSTPKGIGEAVQFVIDSLESLASTSAGIAQSLGIITNSAILLMKGFNELDPAVKQIVGGILGLGTAMVTLGGIIGVGGILMGGISSFAAALGSGGIVATGITGIVAILTGPAGLVVALAAGAAALYKFSSGDAMKQFASDFVADMQHIGTASEENLSKTSLALLNAGKYADGAATEIAKIPPEINKIPDEKDIEIAAQKDLESFEDVNAEIENFEEEKQVDVAAKKDQGTFDSINTELDKFEEDKETLVKPEPDKPAFDKTAAAADKLAEDRMLEIQLKGDIDMELAKMQHDVDIAMAKIEARAETVQTAMEWNAKVDIAEAEAAAKTITAAFEAAGQAVQATAEAAASMFGSLMDNIDKLNFNQEFKAWDMVERQLDMQQQALNIQAALTDAQIKYMEAKAAALRDGNGLVTISSDGLEPALEMIMFEILEKIQVKVNEEGSEVLLGL